MKLGSVLALAVTAAAVLVPPAATQTSSGLFGRVTRGPLTPVCRVGVPCTGPAPGITLEFRRGGAVAGRTVTNQSGGYRISLVPGVYAVRALRGSNLVLRFQPQQAVVRAQIRRRVDFAIDTGIR
jgi:hypothetical protein